MRILVAEDERNLNRILTEALTDEGYSVDPCFDGQEAWDALACAEYDVLVLDIMMPRMDGLTLVRKLRESGSTTPVLFLTSRDSVEDKVEGLETGADDYITKPFDLREVIGRVKAILRRFDKSAPKAEQQEGVRSGKMLISEKEWSVTMDGTRVSLTPKEFELLLFFVKHPRQVFSREQLLARIWGYDFYGDNRTVDIHVQRLRKKLGIGSELVTVFGVGYKYEPGEEQ